MPRTRFVRTCVIVGVVAAAGLGGAAVEQALAHPVSRAATSSLAAPSVTPGIVAPGDRITVHGTGCTDRVSTGAEVSVITKSGRVIASDSDFPDSPFPDGAWTLRLTIPRRAKLGSYTVASTCDEYVDSSSYPAVALAVRARPQVTIKPSSARARHGHDVQLVGTVFPGAAGDQVVVEQKSGRSWTQYGTSVLANRSLPKHRRKQLAYSLSVSRSTRGTLTLRAVAPASAHHAAGVSRTVTIRFR